MFVEGGIRFTSKEARVCLMSYDSLQVDCQNVQIWSMLAKIVLLRLNHKTSSTALFYFLSTNWLIIIKLIRLREGGRERERSHSRVCSETLRDDKSCF